MAHLFRHRVGKPRLQLMAQRLHVRAQADRLDDQEPGHVGALEAHPHETGDTEPQPLVMVMSGRRVGQHVVDQRAALLGEQLSEAVLL